LAPEGRSEKEKELGNEMAMAARLPALARSWAVAAAASPTTTTAYPPDTEKCEKDRYVGRFFGRLRRGEGCKSIVVVGKIIEMEVTR
jgi:hypothetical protein